MNKNRKAKSFILILVIIIITACAPAPQSQITDTPSPTNTEVPHTAEPSPTRTPLPSATPTRMAPPVDATTLNNKVIFGYQGWFSCVGDGAGFDEWNHWFAYGSKPVLDKLTVDYWPDVRELTPEEQCVTDIILPDGNPLVAYSAYNTQTVVRHFQWMEEYGIDGVEVQRFTIPEDYNNMRMRSFRNQVLENVRLGAEIHGRVFYIQFAAVQDGGVELIKKDWKYLVDEMKITESPQYLHHNDLPVIGLWGIGFNFETGFLSPEQAIDLIQFFKSNPDPKYRAIVNGGVPAGWRTLTGASFTDPVWGDIYRSLDVINPWSVGGFNGITGADNFLYNVILPDLAETSKLGIDYMPVVWPGFSWQNLWALRGREEIYNQIPRNGGQLYWQQVYNVISAGAEMIEVAMFDEIDEGTAMYKLAETKLDLPEGKVLVPLNIDGFQLPSDWYIRLGAETGKMLRGESPLSADFPFPDELDQYAVDMIPELPSVVGEWEATDIDGSPITLNIREIGDGEFTINLLDQVTTACGNHDIDIRVKGRGEGRGDSIYTPEFTAACQGNPPWSLFTVNYELTYDPTSDTLLDIWELIWSRK
jgi:hypothetical protein